MRRMRQGVGGVFVGRGVLRNPWLLSQARDLLEGRPTGEIRADARGWFLLQYIDLLMNEGAGEAEGFRHHAPMLRGGPMSAPQPVGTPVRGREKWVINKLRALCAWYSKGLAGGSDLRTRVNATQSVAGLRTLIEEYFLANQAA